MRKEKFFKKSQDYMQTPQNLHIRPRISSRRSGAHARNHPRRPGPSSPPTPGPYHSASPPGSRDFKIRVRLQEQISLLLHGSTIGQAAHSHALRSRGWSPIGIDAALGNGGVIACVAGVGAGAFGNGFVGGGRFDVGGRAITIDGLMGNTVRMMATWH